MGQANSLSRGWDYSKRSRRYQLVASLNRLVEITTRITTQCTPEMAFSKFLHSSLFHGRSPPHLPRGNRAGIESVHRERDDVCSVPKLPIPDGQLKDGCLHCACVFAFLCICVPVCLCICALMNSCICEFVHLCTFVFVRSCFYVFV